VSVIDFKKIDEPLDDTVIWRYISFERFRQLINSSELCFSRVDQFSDFTEGMMTKKTFDCSVKDFMSQGLSEQEALQIASAQAFTNRFLHCRYFYAICWAGLGRESNLLWRSYGTPRPSDEFQFKVAIKTTVGKLKSALADTENLPFGRAKYIDFEVVDPYENAGNEFSKNVFLKKIEYEDEHEVRVAFIHESHDQQIKESLESGSSFVSGGKQVTLGSPVILGDLPDTPQRIPVRVDLGLLIDEIYVEAIHIDHEKLKKSTAEIERVEKEGLKRYHLIRSLLESNGLDIEKIFLSSVF